MSSKEIRIYPDGRKELCSIEDMEIKAAYIDCPIAADAMSMIIKAHENHIDVDDWIFICHPSFVFAKISNFMGHKVKADSSCPKDALYFMEEPKPENYIGDDFCSRGESRECDGS